MCFCLVHHGVCAWPATYLPPVCALCSYAAAICPHLGRRTADTQKLTQNILAANDQRLMAIALTRQQQAAARAAASQIGTAQGCSRAASAAQLLKAAELYNGNVSAWEHLAEDDDRAAWGAGPAADSSSGGGGSGSSSLESGFYGDGAAAAAPVRRSKRRKAGLRHGSRTELQDVPFGMLVLEVLLDATAGGLARVCVWGGLLSVCVCVLRGWACTCVCRQTESAIHAAAAVAARAGRKIARCRGVP